MAETTEKKAAGFDLDGFLAHEAEHCQGLENFGKMAREAGYHVPGETELADLNPDGSYVNADENQPAPDEEENHAAKQR
jgi:hypothetical protein